MLEFNAVINKVFDFYCYKRDNIYYLRFVYLFVINKYLTMITQQSWSNQSLKKIKLDW